MNKNIETCQARLGICWDKNDCKKNNIIYCKRKPKKNGYCTQHYKIHIIEKQPNTKYEMICCDT